VSERLLTAVDLHESKPALSLVDTRRSHADPAGSLRPDAAAPESLLSLSASDTSEMACKPQTFVVQAPKLL